MLAAGGAVALLAGVALINSHRAAIDRAGVRPRPDPARPSTVTALPAPNDTASWTCVPVFGGSISVEASLPYAAPGHPDLRVSSTRCADPSGMRDPSLVHVVDLDDDHRIIATLIRPAEQLHLASLSVAGSAITVTAYQASTAAVDQVPRSFQGGSAMRVRFLVRARSGTAGGIVRIRFSSTDGVHFVRGTPQPVAGPCRADQVQLTAAAVGSSRGAPASVVLRLHNTSGQACAIEGYPQVMGGTTTGDLLRARPQLSGPNGGVIDAGAPPVVLLTDWASAVIDPASSTASCTDVTELIVALPDGDALGGVAIRMRACEFRIHPLVPGTTGSEA